MKRLVVFELKKNHNIRFIKVFIIALVFVNLFNIYKNYDLLLKPTEYIINSEVCTIDKVKYRMDTDYSGAITAEKVNALKTHYNRCQSITDGKTDIQEKLYFPLAYTDMVQTEILLNEMERLYKYDAQSIEKLLQNNEMLKAEAQGAENEYNYRIAALIEKVYSNRSLSNFYRVNEYEPLLTYQFSSLCVLLLSCFAAAYLFSGEKENGMNSLIRATEGGNVKIFIAKATGLFIFCVETCAFFFISDFVLFGLCRKPTGLFEPIYSLKAFEYAPLNTSILLFYLLLCFIKLLGVFAVANISMFFSAAFRKSYISLLCSLLSIGGFMYSGLYTDGMFSVLKHVNPISLITSVNLLQRFYVENIFGHPVFSVIVTMIGVLSFGVVLCIIAYKVSIWRRPANA